MFRIRRIFYDESEKIQGIFRQMRRIFKDHFSRLTEDELDKIFYQFKNPTVYNMQPIIFIADNSRGRLLGCCILLYEPTINFFYLDYIAVRNKLRGRGIGAALYRRAQEEAIAFNTNGIFYDVYTDNPKYFSERKIKENKRRLKFYEEFGAYPIINTRYEHLEDGESNPCYLVYDKLDDDRQLSKDYAVVVVRTILERRYSNTCPVQFVESVLESFKDDPVKLREPLYKKKRNILNIQKKNVPKEQMISVIVNEIHSEFKVTSKGYFEVPVRVKKIEKAMRQLGFCSFNFSREFPDDILTTVHDEDYVRYLREVSKIILAKKEIYPEVFPNQGQVRLPKDLINRMGYYTLEANTPIMSNLYNVAKRAVECAVTAAEIVKNKKKMAYALIRPPGHHAKRNYFGGYCFFNNTAIASNYLSKFGKVAILDIDYHHGNGTQEIFYNRSDVFTCSLHGDPEFEYPYFSGFTDEIGEGDGIGYNFNIPLPENTDGTKYLESLKIAIQKIKDFKPDYLVIALGFDIAKRDPTGTFLLEPKDFKEIGYTIGSLKYPTLVIQEGGYLIVNLTFNAMNFFSGLWSGYYGK